MNKGFVVIGCLLAALALLTVAWLGWDVYLLATRIRSRLPQVIYGRLAAWQRWSETARGHAPGPWAIG
jgi:hypothetical protein